MPQLVLTLVGFLAGLLVPIRFGLGLAAGQADASGQYQYVGGDGIPLLVASQLYLVQDLCQVLVLARIEQLSCCAQECLIFG